jgi:hypothetical protein
MERGKEGRKDGRKGRRKGREEGGRREKMEGRMEGGKKEGAQETLVIHEILWVSLRKDPNFMIRLRRCSNWASPEKPDLEILRREDMTSVTTVSPRASF